MPSHTDSTSGPPPTRPNAFHTTFLEQLQATNEPLGLRRPTSPAPGVWRRSPASGLRRRPAHLGEPGRGDIPLPSPPPGDRGALCRAAPLAGASRCSTLRGSDPEPSGPSRAATLWIAVFGEQARRLRVASVVPPGDRGGPRSVRGPGPHAAQPRRGQRGGGAGALAQVAGI